MSLSSIVMPYKQNCKAEGEIITKFKIARMFFADGEKQIKIATAINSHKNTVNKIIGKCDKFGRDNPEIWDYLKGNKRIEISKLNELFGFFEYKSRKPNSNKRCLNKEDEEKILKKYEDLNYGPKRLFKHLKRKKTWDMGIFTLHKIKGVYKRNKLKTKKVRTKNGNRRALYAYDRIEAFEFLQYDVKEILDLKALPKAIYDKFQKNNKLPKYQWTIVDAKTRIRFLAWSYTRSSFFGFTFLKYTINWLRSHGIHIKINVQFDGGSEFCSASPRKTKDWNKRFEKDNVHVYDTGGVKWKQNLVERTHRIDDEEFYCPVGEDINTKAQFITEGQNWIIDYNNRPSDAIGLNGISPKEKLDKLGVCGADKICKFPIIILDDFFFELKNIFTMKIPKNFVYPKSQNVLTPYLCE